MTLRETPETMAATLRRAGINVQPPECDTLREQLEATLRRMEGGKRWTSSRGATPRRCAPWRHSGRSRSARR